MMLHLRGRFLPDEEVRDAWIVDGNLQFHAPPRTADITTVSADGWFIPGFVDAHCHIGIAPTGNVMDRDKQRVQALQDRDAGALLLRDCGSPADTTWVQSEEELPRLIRAGKHIARSRRYIRGQAVEVEPEGLVAEVERQAGLGDGWIKIVADWIDRPRGDLASTFPASTLAAAVARAHELGARVGVHAFGEEAARDAIAAGVDSIEHATGVTEDMLDAVGEGTAIVPTLINIDHFHAIARQAEGKFPTYARHMQALFATSRERVRAAWESGVQVYVGTDAGGTLPHGLIRGEISALMGAGIPLAEVLAQASWRGREWLGLPGLVDGAPADLIAYDADPRRDLAVLYDPRRVVLRGRVVG